MLCVGIFDPCGECKHLKFAAVVMLEEGKQQVADTVPVEIAGEVGETTTAITWKAEM